MVAAPVERTPGARLAALATPRTGTVAPRIAGAPHLRDAVRMASARPINFRSDHPARERGCHHVTQMGDAGALVDA